MDSSQLSAFAEALKRCRTEAGLTQEELAERAGLSARGISDLERGISRAPQKATMQRLVDALGLTEETRSQLDVGAPRRIAMVSTSDTRPNGREIRWKSQGPPKRRQLMKAVRGSRLAMALLFLGVGLACTGVTLAFVARQSNASSPSTSVSVAPVLMPWGPTRVSPLKFLEPMGVATDQENNLYVVDTLLNQILKLSPSGQLLARWGSQGSGPGQFEYPSAVAVDRQGNMYVADTANDRVQELSPSGRPLHSWSAGGHLMSPSAVAVDSRGRIYAASAVTGLVTELSPDGRLFAQWAGLDRTTNSTYDNAGLATDGEDKVYFVYLGCTQQGTIRKFSTNGNLLATFGSGSRGARPLGAPAAVAVDGRGTIYVVDIVGNRLEKLSADGKALATWGTVGVRPGQFYGPSSVAVSPDGSLYVADIATRRVQKLAPDGKPVKGWRPWVAVPLRINHPSRIAVNGHQRVYVLAGDSIHRLERFSSTGRLLSPWGARELDETGPFALAGLAVYKDGTVYLTDELNARVDVLSPSGRLIARWPSKNTNQGQPAAIAVDRRQNVYIADVGDDRVRKFSARGNVMGIVGQFLSPQEVATDSQGAVYVSYTNNTDTLTVAKLSPAGEVLSRWQVKPPAIREHARLVGMAVNESLGGGQSIYMVDASAGALLKFSSDGTLIARWGPRQLGGNQLRHAGGIAVDSNDTVYITDPGNSRIWVVSLRHRPSR